MADSRAFERSLRWDGPETRRLFWALGLSLLLHGFCFGTYKLGERLHIWERLTWPAWLKAAKLAAIPEAKKQQPPDEELPLVFIEVNPASATAEAPKEAAFYSDKNAQAANPEAEVESNVPKITGTQEVVPRTETVPREEISKLQPSRPAEQAAQTQEEARPKSAFTPGDLALAKPEDVQRPSDENAKKPRPRRIAEALAQKPQNKIRESK